MYGINNWMKKVKKAYSKLFKQSLSPVKTTTTTRKPSVKRPPRKTSK